MRLDVVVLLFLPSAVSIFTTKPTGASAPAASSFKQLSFLDRFLAVWIFLAMAIGIILGYFVPETSPALQRGKFVDVSIPIGMSIPPWPTHLWLPSANMQQPSVS